MKLKTFFAESAQAKHPYKNLDDLLGDVKKYFEISNYKENESHVAPGHPVQLSANLSAKMSVKFSEFPVTIFGLTGKLDLRGSDIKTLANIPASITQLVLGSSDAGPTDLLTAGHCFIATLTIDGLQSLANLNNSGITVATVNLARCNSLTTLKGIEKFPKSPAISNIAITINNCPNLEDDLMDYPDYFMFTFKDKTIPKKMPLVQLIAQDGNNEFPQVDFATMNALKSKFPEFVTSRLFGGGAQAILPLTRYFRNKGT